MKQTRGFTLIEVLLAVSISGIVLLTLYKGFSLGIEANRRVRNFTSVEIQKSLSKLSSELRSAFIYEDRKSTIDFIGTSNSLRFISAAPLDDAGGYVGNSDLKETRFYLLPSKSDKTNSLVYGQTSLYAQKGKSKERKHVKLAKRIRSLKFEYYDGEYWQSAWNSAQALPDAVKISIDFVGRTNSRSPNLFSTVVDIH